MPDSIASPNDNRPLPTKAGSVIGFSTYYDGNHYMAAVLSWADLDDNAGMDLLWWRAGFPEPMTQKQMQALAGNHWQDLGRITPDRGEDV
jgi:hypothetical protein